MESAFGPVLAKSFMVERDFIPKLGEYMTPWTKYVDETITTIKPGGILNVINN